MPVNITNGIGSNGCSSESSTLPCAYTIRTPSGHSSHGLAQY